MVTRKTAGAGDGVPGVREAVLGAATHLFAARGFDATPLQAVADAVGATKQAILHHFPSKAALRDAVVEAMLAHWQRTLPRLLMAAASEDRFDAVLGELRRFFAEDPDRSRLIMREVLDRPEEIGRVLGGPVRAWLATIARYIRDGQVAGRHHADVDPEAYLVNVLYFVIAAAASSVTHDAVEPGEPGRTRLERELGRIAKAALFAPSRPRRRSRAATKATKATKER
jgi:TetR/AcrR family transcriptional regulator